MRTALTPPTRFTPSLALACALAWPILSAQAASLQEAAAALGVDHTPALSYSATGHWFQFGQAPAPKLAWPRFDVSSYAATINYEQASARVQITRKQAIEPGRLRPAPVEQRVDQYINADTAWNLAPAPNAAPGSAPVASAQPAAVEERSAEIWATPQGFLKAALSHNATTQKGKHGRVEVSFTPDGKHRYVGTINARNQVERVRTWIDSPVLGDTPVEFAYSDYKNFNGVSFPTYIERLQGGYPVLELKVSDVKLNPEVNLPVPAGLTPAPTTVAAKALADGVYYLTGGTHHSVAIEQRDHVVLVEAPLNEERSLALIAKIAEIIPGKPIKYVINTHAHFDHSGGLRTFVDAGATIVTAQANAPYYQQQWAKPHDLNPDRLAQSHKPAHFETFTGQHILFDGERAIEIYPLSGSGHNDAFAFVYLPREKLVVEADAYTPTAAGVPAPTPANPYSVNLYDNITKRKLEVKQIAALHGPRLVTLDDLRVAIGQSTQARN